MRFGTQGFLPVHGKTADGPWEKMILAVILDDINITRTEMTILFPLTVNITLCYVMFQVDSFYGLVGGLHYFSENGVNQTGASYSGGNI